MKSDGSQNREKKFFKTKISISSQICLQNAPKLKQKCTQEATICQAIQGRLWAHRIAVGAITVIIECGSYKTIVGGLERSRGGAWQQCPCPPTLTKHNVQQTIGHILIHQAIMEEHSPARCQCTTLSSPPPSSAIYYCCSILQPGDPSQVAAKLCAAFMLMLLW